MNNTKQRTILPFFCFGIILLLVNWSSSEQTVLSEKKQQVNFYGSLSTQQNKTAITVDNISINNKFRQIPFFEFPAQKPSINNTKPISESINTTDSFQSAKQEIILTANPKTELVTTKIDLSETAEIIVPNPHTIWVYEKEKGYRKAEYLEVIIISNNSQKTKAHYLLESNTKIYCDEINAAGPIEKIVPLPAIDHLIIKGYKFRVNQEKDNENCQCPNENTISKKSAQ